MTRRAWLLAPLLALSLMLSACSGTGGPGQRSDRHSVDVDTPALRAVKARTDVASCVPGRTTTKRTELPAVTLPCLGGGPAVDLARLRGPAVVNLFAQWCGPCRKELPFYQALHEKAGARVTVLGVDYLDTSPEAALELAQQSGVTYPLAADPEGRLRSELRVRGLPGIVLVDKDGQVSDVQFRSVRSYAELRTLVQNALGVRLPA